MERNGFILNAPQSKRYSDLESTLLRTSNPKYASYFGDGNGRDSYIILNNGGLTNFEKPNMMSRPFKNTLRSMNATPHKVPFPFTYHSDGTGRDTYVI